MCVDEALVFDQHGHRFLVHQYVCGIEPRKENDRKRLEGDDALREDIKRRQRQAIPESLTIGCNTAQYIRNSMSKLWFADQTPKIQNDQFEKELAVRTNTFH